MPTASELGVCIGDQVWVPEFEIVNFMMLPRSDGEGRLVCVLGFTETGNVIVEPFAGYNNGLWLNESGEIVQGQLVSSTFYFFEKLREDEVV